MRDYLEGLDLSIKLENAYNEGFVSYVDGEWKNPYCLLMDTRMHNQWEDGFDLAQQRFART